MLSFNRLNLVEVMLNQLSCKFLRMDGSTAVGRRDEMISAYNRDPSVFIMLLTTRTGGVGISLTAAVCSMTAIALRLIVITEPCCRHRPRLESSN